MVWSDAPSHVCRGGDKRALTFCCPPVKPCPIMIALEEAGLTPQDYIEIKESFARNTRLGEGQGTCFGSLVWCCKPSKPCPLRDMAMKRINMTTEEYMELKKRLSEELVGTSEPDTDSVKALADAFDVSIEEAREALAEADNDLRTAMKILRMKSL
ncbi:methanogenesis marker 9 domain-containing protein [Methanothermobacter marburgensis]|uniref:Predicted metal-binding transcription factor n=1 Tax=Methanothermobacter marburgensis (strain ATCC BAA-927 / DSM 2133 / JCM 14651 / NBRC 100331 / OCM 82 / Marburg) TaxID=79929 RepID=D9PXN5_METTM|nr:methanogenesis marker 9 domain-containing protein [Methanothermobacter marburgensis]ADL58983.1 predicted metal-binding transcription factor [Methanothermobacter marburgensis str. Marburg]WBF09520.1 methanogenesis marker 9 domain-containing protein [Methanothermobacter marburgensis]